jgi:leucyl aminopeptidase (aminopeptidase T)
MIQTMLKTAIDINTATNKMVADNFIKNENFARAYNNFLDSHNEAAKKVVDSSCEFAREVYSTITDRNFYSDLAKIMQESTEYLNIFKF